MMNNSYKFMFLLIMMMSTMIAISSNSWIGVWIGLEINLLAFIPLMSDNKNNLMTHEASLKYFLTQALASIVLLFSILTYFTNDNFIQFNNNFYNSIIFIALLLKSGAAPFHFWFPNVMEGLSWINALILMTWQKIAPMILMTHVLMKPILVFSIVLCTFTGSIGGLNQTSLRKLMAFSSINHLGWMLAAMNTSEHLWMFYFMFYTFLSITMIFLFNVFKMIHINQMFTLFVNSKILKFTLFLNLLSLGGLPPFLGFFPKWLVIQQLINMNQIIIMILIMMMTLVTLFYYMRLCYSAFMLNYFETNWPMTMMLSNMSMIIYLFMTFFSITGLTSISLFMML